MDEEKILDWEMEYQEFEGNFFLVDNGQLKDVRVETEKVLLPETVRVILRQAFLEEKLQGRMEILGIPASVKKIERLAFAGMERLTCVEILSGIRELEPGVFRNCTNLERVILPKTVEVIGSRAFENCINLRDVVLLSDMADISEDAFSGCPLLDRTRVEAGIARSYRRRIEEEEREKEQNAKYLMRRYLQKEKLTEETGRTVDIEDVEAGGEAMEPVEPLKPLSDTVFSIRNSVLESCRTEGSRVVIPEGVTEIASRAFYGMQKVEDIQIPSSVTCIGAEAFEGTAWLEAERKKRSYVAVNGILISAFHDSMVLEARIPQEVWRIAPYAFQRNKVRFIHLPDNVKVIDAYAFSDVGVTELSLPNRADLELHTPILADCCQLAEILVPEKIERLEAGFVENCPALRRVCLKGKQTAVSMRAFSDGVRIWVL